MPAAVDHEQPRLGLQVEGGHLRARSVVDAVVVVDLLMDEGDLVAVLLLHLLGDVGDRAADAALAEGRGREEQDHRLLAQDVREVVAVHVVGRDPGVDLGDVGDLARGRACGSTGGLLADLRHRVVADRVGRGSRLYW